MHEKPRLRGALLMTRDTSVLAGHARPLRDADILHQVLDMLRWRSRHLADDDGDNAADDKKCDKHTPGKLSCSVCQCLPSSNEA